MAMTAVMSTSLKVVSMAALFWASFSRRAMVWRRRVIFTRSSRSCDLARGAERGGGRSAAGGLKSACRASPLVMRPSLPLPGMAAVSSLLSVTMRWAEGASDRGGGGRGRGGAAGARRARAPERGRLFGAGRRRAWPPRRLR